MNFVQASDSQELATVLADEIAGKLRAAIDKQGAASLLVSGGSTPVPFFEALSGAELDWQKVVVSLADERWVPESSDDSNERLVKSHLLQGKASSARFCSLFDAAAESAEAAIPAIEARLAEAVGSPATVVILGMGQDGHTASLFPDTDGLDSAMSLDNLNRVQILRPSISPHARITLTRRMLLDSEHRYLHITGQAKKTLLDEIVSQALPLPIAGFLDQPPITVYWSP